MDNLGIPDLLGSLRLQRNAGTISQELARAGEEVTTGLVADVAAAAGANPQRLYAIERDIALNEGRGTAITTAASRSELSQSALELVQTNIQEIGVSLLAAVDRNDAFSAEFEASQSRSALESAIAALNTRFGERSLFSGAAVDGPAVDSADAILSDIAALTSGLTDPVAAIAAIDTYFADPAGYDATRYLGSTTDAPSVELAEGDRLDYAVRADNQAIKDALKGLVLGVVGSDPSLFPGSDTARLVVLREAGTTSISAVEDVIRVRGEIGFAEERIETASVRNAAEADFLAQARLAIIGRDQFEAAAEFTSLEVQLQSIFQITARLSQLNLNNFLR